MVEVSLTVGKLDASLALLLTKDHHLIEFPTILLPNGVRAGSVIKIRCDQDLESEEQEAIEFQKVQDEILDTFGRNTPQSPILKIKNVTQTSCVLEWDPLELGTASLKNLTLFKDGQKLGAIPQAMTNRTTKLSGLPINKTFQFQLRLDTTAGVYQSNEIAVTTNKMTDLSGITVCLGDIGPKELFSAQDIEDALKNMGAHHPAQSEIKVDTTHFICTRENKQNPEYIKAGDMNIPIIRPEWLKACERERRIVGVRDFYVKECLLPDILAKNYWQGSIHNKNSRVVKETDSGKSEVGKSADRSTAVEDEPKTSEADHPASEPTKRPAVVEEMEKVAKLEVDPEDGHSMQSKPELELKDEIEAEPAFKNEEIATRATDNDLDVTQTNGISSEIKSAQKEFLASVDAGPIDVLADLKLPKALAPESGLSLISETNVATNSHSPGVSEPLSNEKVSKAQEQELESNPEPITENARTDQKTSVELKQDSQLEGSSKETRPSESTISDITSTPSLSKFDEVDLDSKSETEVQNEIQTGLEKEVEQEGSSSSSEVEGAELKIKASPKHLKDLKRARKRKIKK